MSALLLLGKYQLAERLGPQGAVETYGALMQVNGEQRPCIVKWLRADRLPGQSYPPIAARFLAAGQRLLNRHDPDWPVVFDVTQNEQGTFLIREFVASVDLHGLLQAAREKTPAATLAPAVASLVAGKLAQVLDRAHRAEPPLCHLGLCPANVLVTPDGRVLVADFGLLASVRGLVEHGLDRWAFVAPELIGVDIEDLPFAAGVAADLYALGGLIFYLLAGRPPVEARSLTELSERVWEPLPALPGVPAHLNTAIAALTAPDPQSRCKSMEEAVALLSSAPSVPAPNPPQAIERGNDDSLPFYPDSQSPPAPRPPPPGRGRAASKPARTRASKRLTMLAGALLIIAAGLALRSYTVHVRMSDAPAASTRRSVELTPTATDGGTVGIDFAAVSAKRRKLMLVPGHLTVSTAPPNADLWIDGLWQGKTPLEVTPGPGAHRVLLIAPGHLMLNEVYDTTEGELVKRALDPIEPPTRGDAHVDIECHSEGRFPIMIDGLETGLLCPARMVPVASGRRRIAIFIPALREPVGQEVTVPTGSKPTLVRFPN